MKGRGLINLLLAVIAVLLAVIAGVLPLGRDAMLRGMEGLLQVAVDIALFGLVIAVFWGLWSLARYLIREILRAFREAKPWEIGGSALIIAGLLLSILIHAVETGQPFSQVVQELTGAPVGVPETSGQNVPSDFNTEADALAWLQKNSPKPGADGKFHVTIGGQPATFRSRPKMGGTQ